MRFIVPVFMILFILSSCSAPEKRTGGWMLEEANKRIETGIKEFKKQSFAEAEKDFYWALDSYILLDNREGQAAVFLSLGTLYLTQAKMKEAFSMFKKALDISVELNNHPLRIDALSSLAGLYLLTEELSEATEAISQGLELAKEAGLKRRKATLKLGDVSKITGQKKEAFSYYERSLLIYQQLNDNKGLKRLSQKIKDIRKQN